jgi:menaquinol-cytochrome c reductase iron-sulfur subunit
MAERPSPATISTTLPPTGRRPFLVRAAAIVISAVVGLVPLSVGLVTFLDPLRRGGAGGRWFRVGSVDSLKVGVPERVTIVGDRRDGWTEYHQEPIGAIFLVSEPTGGPIKAFNATCPHAGCSVAFQPTKDCFLCPCHTSSFDLEGRATSPVPPRGMDSLECQVREQGEIWVKYEDFLTGTTEKIPKA